jgi:hypothetical protein
LLSQPSDKPPGARQFASRQAWGLQVAYGSQFETPHDRALSKAQDIRYRLGGQDYISVDGLPPPKPKGMHWRTYEEKIKHCEAYEAICNQYLMRFVGRFSSEFGNRFRFQANAQSSPIR